MGVRSLEPCIVMLNVFQHLEQTDLLASKLPLDGQKFDLLWNVSFPLYLFFIYLPWCFKHHLPALGARRNTK